MTLATIFYNIMHIPLYRHRSVFFCFIGSTATAPSAFDAPPPFRRYRSAWYSHSYDRADRPASRDPSPACKTPLQTDAEDYVETPLFHRPVPPCRAPSFPSTHSICRGAFRFESEKRDPIRSLASLHSSEAFFAGQEQEKPSASFPCRSP